ncbi:hypothetical protein B0H11DRAFT_1928526 [Mycena galericulata]|nr:hypothetical protein B0H11DRAFT_1928526 [Mycena galericulata]
MVSAAARDGCNVSVRMSSTRAPSVYKVAEEIFVFGGGRQSRVLRVLPLCCSTEQKQPYTISMLFYNELLFGLVFVSPPSFHQHLKTYLHLPSPQIYLQAHPRIRAGTARAYSTRWGADWDYGGQAGGGWMREIRRASTSTSSSPTYPSTKSPPPPDPDDSNNAHALADEGAARMRAFALPIRGGRSRLFRPPLSPFAPASVFALCVEEGRRGGEREMRDTLRRLWEGRRRGAFRLLSSFLLSQSTLPIAYTILRKVEKEVVLLEPSPAPLAAGLHRASPRTEPNLHVLKTTKKVGVEVLCSHNPAPPVTDDTPNAAQVSWDTGEVRKFNWNSIILGATNLLALLEHQHQHHIQRRRRPPHSITSIAARAGIMKERMGIDRSRLESGAFTI